MFVMVTLLAMATSGCSIPLGDQKPSVTLTTHYTPPSPTPLPCPTAAPAPSTSWNGMLVKLHGNVSVSKGEHVFGTIKINYLDKNYWDDHPTAVYDTNVGGAYSVDVRAKVPFKVEIGYLYVGQLPAVMNVKKIDMVYTIEQDTPLDFEVMTSNITPIN
ncbi:MAG TPA: hypothetical protein VMC61_02390 [Methanocella sp.]|nr:hypothetical protein [Methanocella sp.]